MLKIAVCDDQEPELQRLHALMTAFLEAKAITAEVVLYSHADELLTAIETTRFHIYLLDIVMPMVNGLELGRAIRRLDRDAQIIYATTEPQYALQAYAAAPINYLVKPVDPPQLFETLLLAIARTDLNDEPTFVLKTADSLRILKLTDITGCEYRSHAVLFTLSDGREAISRTIRIKFTDYCAPLLADRHFLQCHASFIVNMRRIEQFSRDCFMLRGGKRIPIAAKYYPAVRETYMDYLLSRNGDKQ